MLNVGKKDRSNLKPRNPNNPIKMPSLCAYGMCHNLASSTWSGYCNQNHYDRAMLMEAKERVQELEEKLKKKQQQEMKQEKEEDKKK